MKCYQISMAVLFASAVLASCSKNDILEQNKNAIIENQKAEYNNSFIEKYGEVNPEQSWDFTTGFNSEAAGSRLLRRAAGDISVIAPVIPQFIKTVRADLNAVKSNINNAETKTWNPRIAVKMYAVLAHGDDDKMITETKTNYLYYHLDVFHDGTQTKVIENVNVKFDRWYDAANQTLNNSSHNRRAVDTRELGNDAYWVAYYTYASTDQYSKEKNNEILADLKKFELKTYKEYTVNGRTYWGFDCTADGDYSDLVFLVQDVVTPPIQKRYMVEDLGSVGDFDFNDIVFDVIQDSEGQQKCIIRAMGGTLDFTLQVGDTKWTKSVNGAAKGYEVSKMYNTNPIDGAMVIDEFEVKGWNPAANNVSISVTSKVNDEVIIVIPFPKKGEVPMMIALDTFYTWMPEQESLAENWYYILEDEEKAE